MRYFSLTKTLRDVRPDLRFRGERVCACLFKGGERGGSLVESALVLPVILVVMLGIMFFGVTLNNYLVLTNAVANGAQLLSISRGQTTNPCSTAATAIYAAAPNLTQASISLSFVIDGVSFNNTNTCTGGAADMIQGAPAKITATYPCSLVIYGVNYGPSPCLQAQLTEIIQ